MTRYLVLHHDTPVRAFEFMSLAVLYVHHQDRPEEYRIETVEGEPNENANSAGPDSRRV